MVPGPTNRHTLGRQAHILREGGMRHPFGRVPSVGLFQHAVNLFEGEAFHFGDEEVGEHYSDAAQGAPEEEDWEC